MVCAETSHHSEFFYTTTMQKLSSFVSSGGQGPYFDDTVGFKLVVVPTLF